MFKIIKNFLRPQNYKKIDSCVSRSAQPDKMNIRWLKRQGVTDIINFRTMGKPDINFDEKEYVNSLGLNYHNIPSSTKYPTKENVGKFLDIVENVKNNGGKVHIHCKAGADRTGMYSYIYERINNIGTVNDNLQELKDHFWHKDLYPYMNEWAELFISMFKK